MNKTLYVLFVSVLIGGSLWLSSASRNIDFFHYWMVGKYVAQSSHPADWYSLEGNKDFTRFVRQYVFSPEQKSEKMRQVAFVWLKTEPTGTPLFYAILGSFSKFPYDLGIAWFQVLMTILASLSLLLLSNLFTRYSFQALVISFVALGCFYPFWYDINTANCSRIMLFSTSAVLFLAGKGKHSNSIYPAFIATLMTCFKPITIWVFPIYLVLKLFMKKKILYDIVGSLLAMGTSYGIGAWFSGDGNIWMKWHSGLGSLFAKDDLLSSSGNVSLTQAIRYLLNQQNSSLDLQIGVIGFFITILGIGALNRWRCFQQSPIYNSNMLLWLVSVAIGAPLFLLTTSVFWIHYALLCFPVILFALLSREMSRIFKSIALVGILSSGLVCILGFFGVNNALVNVALVNTTVFTTLFIGFVLLFLPSTRLPLEIITPSLPASKNKKEPKLEQEVSMPN